jgi:hypothetical protein
MKPVWAAHGGTGLSQVFIVTDAMLWRDVREVAGKANAAVSRLNFMINKNQDRAAGQAGTQGARACHVVRFSDALGDLVKARQGASPDDQHATGSGKTIIMTALFAIRARRPGWTRMP